MLMLVNINNGHGWNAAYRGFRQKDYDRAIAETTIEIREALKAAVRHYVSHRLTIHRKYMPNKGGPCRCRY